MFSINALWKNKIAVLVGDYLLSKGLLLSLENKDFEILTILSNAVKKMSEGELLQMEKARNLNFDESVYYEIINGKTASLLSSSCGAGAASVSKDEAIIQKMREFGEMVGMAFQIKDDLFDYGDAVIGKPTGNDIKEKKLTLPLIHILQKVDPSLKKEIINIVKNNNNDKKKVKFVIDNVVANGGIEYATQKMIEYRDKAMTILYSFPESPSRAALEELVRYTTDRAY
jgi:octaprenyl-diphosphate synthase